MTNIVESFGEHLRTLRKAKGLTQVALAYRGEFNRNYIGMLERGERNPSLKNLKRLADALNISLKELLNFDYE
jgi:transcriptional regulator with XRE-family HTH domain